MSFVGLFGKRTWLGLASAVAALLLCVMLGALLVVKGALPSGMTVWWVYGSCGLAAFLGGCMARKGGGEAVLSLITAALLYALLYIFGLAFAFYPLTRWCKQNEGFLWPWPHVQSEKKRIKELRREQQAQENEEKGEK